LPGAHTADPWDTGAQRGGQLGQAMQRMPAARGHDHRPVHLRARLRYPGPRDQRRGATGAPGLQRRADRDHRRRGRPRGGSGYPPGQVAGPSASRRSPGSPLPPGPPDEPSAPPRAGRADGYLSPIDWRGAESFTDIPRRSVSPYRWTKRRGRPSLGPVLLVCWSPGEPSAEVLRRAGTCRDTSTSCWSWRAECGIMPVIEDQITALRRHNA
jgi:hypothetical protein